MRFARAALLGAVLSTAFGAAETAAQEGEVEGKIYGDWKVVCPKDEPTVKSCQMFQNIVDTKSEQRLLQIIVGYIEGAPLPIGVLSLPLGIYLPKGVSMQVDNGQVYEMAVELCAPNGCRLRFSFDDNLLAAVKAGAAANVAFHFDPRKPAIKLPVSLKGFTAALNALR